jgi:hypothetical protein
MTKRIFFILGMIAGLLFAVIAYRTPIANAWSV